MSDYYTIARVITEHNILTLPGLVKVRVMCRCGWREEFPNEENAKAISAEHVAQFIMEALQDLQNETVVDAEVVHDETEG